MGRLTDPLLHSQHAPFRLEIDPGTSSREEQTGSEERVSEARPSGRRITCSICLTTWPIFLDKDIIVFRGRKRRTHPVPFTLPTGPIGRRRPLSRSHCFHQCLRDCVMLVRNSTPIIRRRACYAEAEVEALVIEGAVVTPSSDRHSNFPSPALLC